MKNKNIYELTNPQKSILFTEQFYSDTTVNNICTSAIIYEEIDETLLKKAIYNVVKQNDSFRIHMISCEDNTIKQIISDFTEFNIDVSYIDTEDDVKLLQEEEVKYKFEFLNSDLFKFKIFILKNKFAGVILTVNHIIADSWSLGLVIQDILKNYHCLKNNTPIESSNYSYTNYINLEEEYKSSKRFQEDKKYWEEMFQTIPEQATIPSFKGNLKNVSNAAERLSFNIDKNLLTDINVFCKENNISVFNFFITIFSIYIGRVSNIDDFVIGTPILNRINYKDKHTMGMFVNTVPIRVNNFGNSTFKEMAKCSNRNLMNILRHQKYSYNSILEDLRRKNENVPNLYNIIISYQVTKAFNEDFGNYKTDWIFNHYCANDFNIHLYDINDTGNLIVNYDYLIDKYSKEDVCAIHNRIMHMIDQILANNDVFSDDIEIVTEEEKDKILNVFNNTNVDYPRDKTIVDLFEEQVRKTPDNIAVVFEDKKLTYKELNEKSNQLARHLIEQGIKPHTVIGLRLNKRLEMIVGILAIIKAGCCYLPINMQYPEDRVDFMLNDSNAKLLLGTQDSITDIEINLKKIDISLDNNDIYNHEDTDLGLKISPEDLIYIIYTSGSTGKPKGAMLCHRNVVRLFKNDKCLFDFNENDVWVMFHSVAFDFSVWEMYGALLFGGKLVLISDETAQDPKLFLNLIRNEHVTVLNQTPTYFYKLLKAELDRTDNNVSIRYIIFGGEALKPNLIKGWYLKYPETKLINMYGITETTVHVTFRELSESDLDSPSSNIGVPIPTLHVIIVDKNLKLLPFGTIGEMCVLGEGVFKGYLNREDLNKTKLVKIPNYSDKLIYRSGDTAIMHEDGHLEYMGRIDTQVKIRGFRVELGEIEEKILKYSNIDTCIVAKKVDEFDRELLCAYYIKNGPLNISALRILLNKHLPSYMIPQYFIEIDKVPININGKTDFKALPLPKNAQTGVELVKPRNKIDKCLLEIYENTLHVSNISMSDSFFELGGDSLTAINISETISKKFNVEITVKDILEKNIIMDLSDYISGLSSINTNSFEILPADKCEFYPLSSAQKRIYYACKMIGDENVVYNTPGAVLINGLLDKEKVENCFKEIIKKQNSFRTSFLIVNNTIMQKINSSVKFAINTFKNKSTEINNLINNFSKPFNLKNAPLLRVELHYLDNKKTLLLLESHHIIMDGTSLKILINDFCKLYSGNSIDNLDIEYKDFSTWENKFLESTMIKESENYWLNKFKNSELPTINLPYDFNIPSSRSYKGNTISRQISEKDFNKYITSAKEFGVSPYMFFLSALFVLLYKYTGQEEIIVGSPVSGRNNSQVQNIIGMFVNNIAIDGKIDSSKKFVDFLNTIKLQVLDDLKYQNYPYNLLIKKLNIPNDTINNPLFDVMFAYQNANSNKLTLDNETVEIIKSASGISKFNLSVEIEPDTKVVNLEYRTDLFKEDTINRLFNHFINTLNSISDNNDILIKDISIISDEEKNKILYEFNATEFKYNYDDHIHTLFEKQVKSTPDSIALVFEENTLSYNELNEKANAIAFYLKSKNIKQHDIIGIMAPRSLELIVAMLGVLKSGACYIPIDPSYPQKRIEYMLENSNAKLLLTTKEISENINFANKLLIDLDNKNLYHLKKENINCKISPESPAYIIYTSGSTGLPKGVILKHLSLTNLCNYLNNNVEFLKKDDCKCKNIISVTTASFDIFIFESLIALQRGLKVIIANENEQRMPNLLNKLITKNTAIAIQMTPSRMQFFVDNINDIPALSKLKYVTLAGEPLPLKLKNELLSLGIEKVYNGYGPSETTVFSTFTDVTNQSLINIGKPLYNTQMYILDKDLNPVPIGIPGELYISGDGVGDGYLNKENLTKERFINNPFKNSSIMYKTGDLCKFNAYGELYYLERIDNQVKIRGLRIELNEIENKILEFPFIEKVKVIKQQIGNREFISAYFIANKRIRITDLRKHLSEVLPNYMIPSYFTPLNDFPYTPNGKIDKNALPIPAGILNNPHKYVPPKTDLELRLVSIWEQILNTKPIGITDNFFELGGDSILAMNLNIQLLKLTNKITYSDIFSCPTILEQENKINSLKEANHIDDFSELKEIYSKILNTTVNLPSSLEYSSPKNILLTGVTGFLGIHILDSFLQNESGNIYAVIRREPGISPKDKLLNKLHYYFGDKYDNEINNRIFIVEGDTSLQAFGLNQENLFKVINSIDTIVNAAAKVSHYGSYTDFYNVNVKGVENLIDIASNFNKKLYHISTLSVSGNSFVDQYYNSQEFKNDVDFSENNFYIGQSLDNVYIKSKFEAEKLILDSILKGTDAYILRVGNLMPRYIDGKFQENYMDNAYINRINSFYKVGCIPNNILNAYLEFTPIDYTANAILKIMQFNTNTNRIFHIFNHNHVYMEKLLSILQSFGKEIRVVESEEFKKVIKKILNSKKSDILNNVINDFDKDMNLSYENKIHIKSEFTIKYLDLCNFNWPVIQENYIKFILNLLGGE